MTAFGPITPICDQATNWELSSYADVADRKLAGLLKARLIAPSQFGERIVAYTRDARATSTTEA